MKILRTFSLCLSLGLALALSAPGESHAQTAGYLVPKCTGDPRKDTPVMQEAFARGGTLLLPACQYWISKTLRLKNGTRLIGAGAPNTKLFFVMTNGTPAIDSDPSQPLTDVYIADLQIEGKYGMGIIGMGDGLQLYGVTDSTFERLKVANFRGNGFTIRKPTGQAQGLVRTHFDSIFAIAIGTYAFDIDGTVDASWNMIDINSSATGAYRFREGSSGAPQIEITGFIAEWHKTYSSKNHVVLFDDPNGQSIRFRGCAASTFAAASPANLTFIKASGTVRVEFVGCTGGGGTTNSRFKNWIVSPSRTVAYMPRINSVY